MDLTSAVASSDVLSDSGVPPAEASRLVTEFTHLHSFPIESSDSPSPHVGAFSVESLDPHAEPFMSAEDLPHPPPVDLLLSPAIDGLVEEECVAQAVRESPVQEFAEYRNVSFVHQCSHDDDEEEAEEQHLE